MNINGNIENDSFIKELNKKKTEAKNKLFGNRIKLTFLYAMENKVLETIIPQLFKYYPDSFTFSGETLLRGGSDARFEFEICRMIVGIHRSNVMFLNDYERANKQNNKEYKEKLCNQVVTHIKLRNYSARYARSVQLIAGDEFLFFPVPYKLFAMTMRALEILGSNRNIPFYDMYSTIFNKSLSALCLLENNMFDSAYPICRTIIEVFIKLHILLLNPGALESYKKHCLLELDKSCKNGQYSNGFNDLFDNRKYKQEKNKINYLHFGWVDQISDYKKRVEYKRYSLEGLCEYLDSYYSEITSTDFHNFHQIYQRYTFCHTFAHGTTGNTGYPLAHYLNIASFLGATVENVYRLLCDRLNINNNIEGVDIISEYNVDFDQLCSQIDERSTQKFNDYYKTFNALKYNS